jgi:hypothetical protein
LAVLHGFPAWGWVLVAIDAGLAIGFFAGGMGSMSSAPSMDDEPVTMPRAPSEAMMSSARPARSARAAPKKPTRKAATKRRR